MSYDIDHEYDIAIIGLSGRFPGARSTEAFWNNLQSGTESITDFSAEELLAAGVSPELLAHSRYVKKAPVLEQADHFDAAFFGYTPAEAELIDPQQRLLLEAGWDALEQAGYDISRIDEPVAVFASTAMNTYLLTSGLSDTFDSNYLGVLLGSDKDFQATRLAFKLGLKGPAVSVQTACSSSLVAIHMACQSLYNKECTMALVGAAAVRTPLATGHLAESGSVFTPDGHCRPFDAQANGTIFGSGAAMAVLKPCIKAIEDGDPILAVIKGTAINNDGASKSDFTAPSITMQAEVISEALGVAGLEADDISYVEAHGTGTFIGDPIEVEALSLAWSNSEASTHGSTDTSNNKSTDTPGNTRIPIGSVKSNIGHLDAAAGMASLIKVVLALQHQKIPPTINFTAPNPEIDFDNSPFRVAHTLEDWARPASRLRTAGITSLGMGGTNAHIIVQEFADPEFNDPVPVRSTSQPATLTRHLLPLSANNTESLDQYLTSLADHFKALVSDNENANGTATELQSIATTLQTRRSTRDKRAFVIADSIEAAANALQTRDKQRLVLARAKPLKRDITLLFPGQGSQHIGMGAALYERENVYRDSIDQSASLFSDILDIDIDIRDLMFGSGIEGHNINDTVNAQPCLFATHLAYAALFASWGITAKTVVGHSIGQFAAGVIAGIFTHADGARLVAARGKLMQTAPRGVMLSVALPITDLAQQLDSSLEIAVSNSEDSTVVGGPAEAIRALAQTLDSAGIKNTELRTSHAFHTSLMETAASEFEQVFTGIELKAPTLRMLSDSTGQWLSDAQATSPAYWSDHIIKTVNFHTCLTTLLDDGPGILLETGPNATLASIASVHASKGPKHQIVSAASKARNNRGEDTLDTQLDTHEQALSALGQLWLAGLDVAAAYRPTGNNNNTDNTKDNTRYTPLPTAPFVGKPHWYRAKALAPSNKQPSQAAELMRESDMTQWVWSEAWMPLASLPARGNQEALLLNDASTGLLQQYSLDASHVPLGHFDTEMILRTMQQRNIHTVSYVLDSDSAPILHIERLLELSRALMRFDGQATVTLNLISIGLFDGNNSNAAIAMGFVEVVPLEMPHIFCKLVDLPSDTGHPAESSQLAALLLHKTPDTVVKLRDDTVYARRLQKLVLNAEPSVNDIYRDKTHVITGAFGGVGRVLASHIAHQGGNLLLLSRTRTEDDLDAEKNQQELAFVEHLEQDHGVSVTRSIVSLDSVAAIKVSLTDAHRQSPISTVFHLAGHIEDSLISSKSCDSASRVLQVKVDGTRNLHAAMDSIEHARLIVFSSIASWIPAAGQVDYAAANAFQNQFASAHKTQGTPVTSIAWPGWKSTGMLARISDPGLRTAAEQKSIDAADAIALLDIIVASSAAQNLGAYLISPTSLEDEYRMHRQGQLAVIRNRSEAGARNAPTDGDHLRTLDIVINTWRELLGVDEIAADENFFDIGGNSLSAVRMCTQLENRLGVAFSPDNLLNQNTPESIAEYLETANPNLANASAVNTVPADTARPGDSQEPTTFSVDSTSAAAGTQGHKSVTGNLVLLNAGKSTETPLILIHSHGGMLLLYQSLAASIGRHRPVYGLRASGLDGDVPAESSIGGMAQTYADAILHEFGNTPVVIGGYCMGGTIAWETARQLKAGQGSVLLVFLIQSFHRDLDYPTVQTQGTFYPTSAPVTRRISLGADKLRYLIARYRREHSGLLPTLLQLVRGAGNRLRRSLESDATTELAKAGGNASLLAVHRANSDAFWQYTPPAQDVPVLAFRSSVQPSHVHGDKLLGWSDILKNPIAEVELKGSYLDSFETFSTEHISAEIERAIDSLLEPTANETA